MRPHDFGKCATCRNWFAPDEWCVEHEIAITGDSTCSDYARRETQAERDAAIVKSLRDTSEFYRKHGGPASDAGQP